jgi:hypothetical protein
MSEKNKILARSAAMTIIRSSPKATRKKLCCALVGHTRMTTQCFGYSYCGRCEAQVGDALGGVDPGRERAVVKGHGCKVCRANAKTLTWQDKLLMPTPAKWLAKESKS